MTEEQTKTELIKNKLNALKDSLKYDPSIQNAQDTMFALLSCQSIRDCNEDDHENLSIDNQIMDKNESEHQAQYHINNDGDDYVKENEQILHDVENSKAKFFIQCEPINYQDVIGFINGLTKHEIGIDSYGEIEDDCHFDFNKYKQLSAEGATIADGY